LFDDNIRLRITDGRGEKKQTYRSGGAWMDEGKEKNACTLSLATKTVAILYLILHYLYPLFFILCDRSRARLSFFSSWMLLGRIAR
jgi:hypothetical protein